jgi:LPS-assembly protein
MHRLCKLSSKIKQAIDVSPKRALLTFGLCAISLMTIAEPTQRVCSDSASSAANSELNAEAEAHKPSESSDTESTQTLTKQTKVTPEEGVTIYAQEVEYLPEHKLELKGDIEFVHGPYKAQSDSAVIDQTTDTAELLGDIKLSSPDLLLTGDRASMNMTSEKISVTNAKFSNPKTSVNGEASEISRPDEKILIIHDGLFSSCPPEERDWAFAAEKITLDKELGFGHANNTRFLINDTPVLYIPWFSFPIDDRRKSGFLYPTIGSSNTERGIFLSTPYYLNLAPDYDATITPSYIHGRGAHTDLEARHKSEKTDSLLMLGYINEDKHYRDEQIANGLADPGARWGLSFNQDINAFDDGWYGRLQFSDVSDFDYLDDLNQGLNINRQDYLDRRAEFSFSQDDWRLSVLLQEYKSIDEQVLASEQAYQRLPEVNFEFDHIYQSLHLDWDSQYVYFYRDKEQLVGDERIIGSRVRHKPKLSLPMSKSWGYLDPSVTIDHTDYFLQDYTPVDNHISRTIPIYEIDAALFFDKKSIFSQDWFSEDPQSMFTLNSLRHSLEPRAYYVYSKSVDQDDLPNFDSTLPSFNYQRLFTAYRFSGGDRVGDNNRLTLGFTSRWTDMSSGQDKAVFSLGQIYHYNNRAVNINGDGQSGRSDSILASEIILRPFKGVELATTGLWDAREKQTQEGNTRLHIHTDQYRHVLNLSHRYIRNELEQLDSSFITPIYQQLSLIGRWRYDLDKNRTIGTLAGIEYGSCCWRIQLMTQSYLDNDSDILHGVLFRFQLQGVGGFGQSTRRMDQHILGYAAREAVFN